MESTNLSDTLGEGMTMKILIVDDDPAILTVTQKLLSLKQHDVICCDNALDAIQTLGDLSFDILITDATMPAYSGFDLIRSIKKNNDLAYLSIAMLTGRSEKSDIEQAVELGVQDYIVKPIEPEMFLDKIELLTTRHRKRKQQKPKASNFNCDMLVPICINRVTDIGISIVGHYPLPKGTVVSIDFPELQSAGITKNRFKAIFNTENFNGNQTLTELILLDANIKEQKTLESISKKWLKKKVS